MSRTALAEECDCTCHANPDEEVDAHAMPCCMRCSCCGRLIEVALWATHSKDCSDGATASQE